MRQFIVKHLTSGKFMDSNESLSLNITIASINTDPEFLLTLRRSNLFSAIITGSNRHFSEIKKWHTSS